jgi:MFS family permease
MDTRRGIFLLGKIILGVGAGVLISTSQTYVSEIAPTKLRGPLLAMYTFFLVSNALDFMDPEEEEEADTGIQGIGQLIAVSLIFKRILIPDVSAFTVRFAI